MLVPSLAEGFGLPALEAAACGAVVLASDIPSHREVLGPAAARFDPRDAGALGAALSELWSDEDRRRALASAGPPRSREFDWERTARLTPTPARRVSASIDQRGRGAGRANSAVVTAWTGRVLPTAAKILSAKPCHETHPAFVR